MSISDPTYIGQVVSVAGATVHVKLREDIPSTLIMIEGESYRIGQIGGFFRIPLGYANLYGVCTQIGANAKPEVDENIILESLLEDSDDSLSGFRWMTIVLIGEGLGSEFERGVGQFPTVGDEVHLVTNKGLKLVYGLASKKQSTISVGDIATASGIPAEISIAGLISRHSAILGSTGSGKSNLVTVILESLSDANLTNSRIIVIDPHGEYSSALGEKARVFSINPEKSENHVPLWVPFWALPFYEIQQLTFGDLQQTPEATIREIVQNMKIASAEKNKINIPKEVITADTPIPFSIKQLWYELDRNERITYDHNTDQNETTISQPFIEGDPKKLQPASCQPANPGGSKPFMNKGKRKISKQIELLLRRLNDSRYSFLFSPEQGYEPEPDGAIKNDIDVLVNDWVGHEQPITIFDVSKLPSEILTTVIGTMIRVVYNTLYWAQNLPIGGREQPLLIVIDEAHQFLPDGADTATHRILSKIAKEGRKYGIGLMLVSQRPSEMDSTILSQCGSLFALRTTNSTDRNMVNSSMPDELNGITEQLPALRTGEGIFMGEIMQIPSRVRIRKAKQKPIGNDPLLPEAWLTERNSDKNLYKIAVENWRSQTYGTKHK